MTELEMPDPEHPHSMLVKHHEYTHKTGMIVLLALISVLAMLLAAWAAYSVREVAPSRTRVWRAVICHIEQQDRASKTMRTQDKVILLKFYDSLLTKDIHTAPCNLEAP